MEEAFSREKLLLGDSIQRLYTASVALFGVGGVGSFAAEALARSGIGHIALFDMDTVAVSNINRQLIAMTSTVGRPKVDVMKERILDINPSAQVEAVMIFYCQDSADAIDLRKYDYIIDAIDTVSSKILLIENAGKANVPIISCMGAGNKFDATAFEVADIYETSVCPLAKVMRRELRARGIDKLRVVYSKETPVKHRTDPGIGLPEQEKLTRKAVPGSLSYVPPVAGMILAGEVIQALARPDAV